MKKIIWIAALAMATTLFAKTDKLNVLLVLTDDQGYGDLACNGNPYLSTPHIDKFSTESYRFTNYHAATTCGPTRSGLMSAMYCNKVGCWHTIMGRSLLDLKRETFGEVFNRNGYATAMFGKWHLGDNYPYRPMDRGFETTLWFKAGAMGQAPDFWDNTYFDPMLNNGIIPEKHEGFCTDIFFDNAMKFMKKSQADGRPFMCYLAVNAAHSPFVAPEKYMEKFKGNKHIPSAGFYGMIENLDDNMGRMEEFLKETGLDKNTVVIYTSDNGSTFGQKGNVGYNAGMRDKKGSAYDGGHRVPFFMKIPNTKGGDIEQLTGYIDVAPTLYDICGISTDRKLDGISVKAVIDDPKASIDRYLVVDTHRAEFMKKTNQSVVMKGSLRLVKGTELYDVSTDVGQKNDIAKNYPEVVSELQKVFEEYWSYIEPENEIMQPVYIASPDSEAVILNSHDRHISCFWDQRVQIRSTKKTSPEGFWYIKVPEDGEYTFELYRWPLESNINLKDSAPAPSGSKKVVNTAFKDISGAELIIGDVVSKTKNLYKAENPTSINFENVKLKKGEYKLFPNFILSKGKMGAHYVRVIRKF